MLKVSVIIPNYNREDLVGHAIENMLLQSLQPHEVIVVDDGSTDHSMSVIQSFGHRVKVVCQQNKGPGAARNAGLHIATGDFVQFMDSDDLASLNKLEVQARLMLESDADLVYGPWAKVHIVGKTVKLEDVVLQLRPLPRTRDPLLWFLTDWSMVFQQCIVKRSVIEKVGGYREDMLYLEDGDLFVRLLLNNISIAHEPHSLTLYRTGGSDKLTGSNQMAERRAVDQAKFYEMIFHLRETSSRLKGYTGNLAFKFRLNEALKDLRRTGALESAAQQLLAGDLRGNSQYYSAMSWIRNKLYGVKQKFLGHRWHSAFSYGPLSEEKKGLIQMLGYELIPNGQ